MTSISSLDVTKIRQDFPILQRRIHGHPLVYLDNAATSFPKPAVVHETAHTFYETSGVNPGRTGCDLALEAEQMIVDTRKLLSEFFNRSLVEAGVAKGHRFLRGGHCHSMRARSHGCGECATEGETTPQGRQEQGQEARRCVVHSRR